MFKDKIGNKYEDVTREVGNNDIILTFVTYLIPIQLYS